MFGCLTHRALQIKLAPSSLTMNQDNLSQSVRAKPLTTASQEVYGLRQHDLDLTYLDFDLGKKRFRLMSGVQFLSDL